VTRERERVQRENYSFITDTMDTTLSQAVLQGKKKGGKKRNHNHTIDKESCFATRKDRQTDRDTHRYIMQET
jgi:hypothetical protein